MKKRKEVIVSDNELDVSNVRLRDENNDLKSELTKHKVKNHKGMKYKEIIKEFIKNGVIKEKGEERISF